MKSFSQAGQDLFVAAILGEAPGTFLDIGCNHPTVNSNTYALEQLGWRGLLVDSSPEYAALCRAHRLSPVLEADATKIDWTKQLLDYRWIAREADGHRQMMVPFRHEGIDPPRLAIDYLSFDVDEAGLETLKRMPLDRLRFRVITIEHDAYRFGDGPRAEMRRIFNDAGYLMVAGNVRNGADYPFEDWWIGDISEAPGRSLIAHMPAWDDIEWQVIIRRIEEAQKL